MIGDAAAPAADGPVALAGEDVAAGTTRHNAPVRQAANRVAQRTRADLVAGAAGLALFAAAMLTGAWLGLAGRPVRAPAAPLFAHWLPHLGPGTPAALATAGLVVWYGPDLAARLRWRWLLAGAYLAALCWSLSLALVDGWQRGLAGRLGTGHEYLSEVAGVDDVTAMLSTFAGRILDGQPDSWTTHVAGHPPGAFLLFVGLDRLGLSGGGWAAVLCVAAGASVAVTVPVTLRLLGGAGLARAAVPFMVLFPGAVWAGASADGVFAGVTAAGVAALAGAARRGGRSPVVLAGLAGVLLGLGCFLSYGLVLMAPIAAAVLVVACRPVPAVRVSAVRVPAVPSRAWLLCVVVPVVVAGAVAVAALFVAAGFNWLDGYHLVVRRYHQGIAADRPYAYWVWANLSCLVACAGPVTFPAVRRAVAAGPASPLLLPVAAAVAVVLADVSGLSKAEVERIWLPFAVWLVAAAAALPAAGRRGWLVTQAATALLINHLLLTAW